MKLYKNYEGDNSFEFEPRNKITIIVGRNGSGKTAMLHFIQEEMKKDYAVINDDAGQRGDTLANQFDPQHLMYTRFSSEGETLGYSIVQMLLKAKHFKGKGEKVVLCLDKIDSGLSYDNIVSVSDLIKEQVANDVDYIFITANSYELASQFKDFSFYSVEKNEFIELGSYDDFIKLYNIQEETK